MRILQKINVKAMIFITRMFLESKYCVAKKLKKRV